MEKYNTIYRKNFKKLTMVDLYFLWITCLVFGSAEKKS